MAGSFACPGVIQVRLRIAVGKIAYILIRDMALEELCQNTYT
jgi:hypothetical protein